MNKTGQFKPSLFKKTIDIYNRFNISDEEMNKMSVVFLKFNDSVLKCHQNEQLPTRLNNNIINTHKILIFNDYTNINNLNDLKQQKRKFNDVEYELRIIASTWTFERRSNSRTRSKWYGFVYSMNGGSQH